MREKSWKKIIRTYLAYLNISGGAEWKFTFQSCWLAATYIKNANTQTRDRI